MEQSIILLLISLGIVSTILLLYYSLKISSHCCLENIADAKLMSHSVVKPPRWSQSLASKIEYIDDTALDIVRERMKYIEELIVEKLGAVALIAKDEGFYATFILKLKFISIVSKKIGILGAIKLLIDLAYLKRLYKKASKLSGINKKKQEYHKIIERILKHIDNVAIRLEALQG